MTSMRASEALDRAATALERIAAALEERLPPIEDASKIEALSQMLEAAESRCRAASKLNEDLRSDIRALEVSR